METLKPKQYQITIVLTLEVKAFDVKGAREAIQSAIEKIKEHNAKIEGYYRFAVQDWKPITEDGDPMPTEAPKEKVKSKSKEEPDGEN